MSVIGRLKVILGLDNSEFTQGTKAAEQQSAKTSNAIKGNFRTMQQEAERSLQRITDLISSQKTNVQRLEATYKQLKDKAKNIAPGRALSDLNQEINLTKSKLDAAKRLLDNLTNSQSRYRAEVQRLKEANHTVEKHKSAFASLVKNMLGLSAVITVFRKFVDLIRSSISAYQKQEAAERKLESVIRATGGSVGITTDELKEYASQLQSITKFGDEVTLDAMAIASTFKSIRGDNFKTMIAAAQDLATVMGTDLNSATMQLAKALEQPEIGLTMLRRSGVSFSKAQIEEINKLVAAGKKEEAQLRILTEVQSQFGGAAKAAAETSAGAVQQLINAFGDLKESIGASILEMEGIQRFLTRLTNAITDINTGRTGTNEINRWFAENITKPGMTAEEQLVAVREKLKQLEGLSLSDQFENLSTHSQLLISNFSRALYAKEEDLLSQKKAQETTKRLNLEKRSLEELQQLRQNSTYLAQEAESQLTGHLDGEISKRAKYYKSLTQIIGTEIESRIRQESDAEEKAKKAAEAASKAAQEAYRSTLAYAEAQNKAAIKSLQQEESAYGTTIAYQEKMLSLRRTEEQFAKSDEEYRQRKKVNDELERGINIRKRFYAAGSEMDLRAQISELKEKIKTLDPIADAFEISNALKKIDELQEEIDNLPQNKQVKIRVQLKDFEKELFKDFEKELEDMSKDISDSIDKDQFLKGFNSLADRNKQIDDLASKIRGYRTALIEASDAEKRYLQTLIQRDQAQLNSLRGLDKQIALIDSISGAIRNVLNQSISGLFQSLGEALAGENLGDNLKEKVLMPFADMAVQIGEMMIGFGTAGIALENLVIEPWAALAAGAALVALGSAAKSAIQSAINGSTGGGSKDPYTTYTGGVRGGYSNNGAYQYATANVASAGSNITVDVSGALKGEDIALAVKKVNYNRSR